MIMPLNCFCLSILTAQLSRKTKKSLTEKKLSVNVDLLHKTVSSSEEEEERNIENININEISDEEWSDSDDEI